MALITRTRLLVVSTLALSGCAGLIGVNDIFFDDGTSDEGGTSEGGSHNDDGMVSGGDGGADVQTCNADAMVDPLNCGRCGHSCLGAMCTSGACQPLAILNGGGEPYDVALDDGYAYVSNRSDGTVVQVQKDGGGSVTIVDKWDSTSGIAVADGKLFWTAQDGVGNGGVPDGGDNGTDYGGVWSCTIPACADKKLLQKVSYGYQLAAGADGFVYSASEDGVARVATDGGSPQVLHTGEAVYGVAPDPQHVYYMTVAGVQSVQLDGGGAAVFGVISDVTGRIAVDDTHVFWTSSGDDPTDVGVVYGVPKSALGNRTPFGTMNVESLGIVSDGTNVYWANQGHFNSDGTPVGDGNVLACPVTGCVGAPIVLANNLLSPLGIALDNDAVYFAEFGGIGDVGRLLRVAKP